MSFAGFLCSRLGHEAKRAPLRGAIYAEISAVESEDGVYAFALGEVEQGGIGQLWTNLRIPLHPVGNCRSFFPGQGQQFQKRATGASATGKQAIDRFRPKAQQPRRLRDDRPAGVQGAGKLAQGLDTGGMMFVGARQNRHQRPGIDQHATLHGRLPMPWRCRGFVLRSLGGSFLGFDPAVAAMQPTSPASSASSWAERDPPERPR